MDNIDLKEVNINDAGGVSAVVKNIKSEEREVLLKDGDETVGALLTQEQYEWFLDQLDEAGDTSFISKRSEDMEGSISLDDLKKELEE